MFGGHRFDGAERVKVFAFEPTIVVKDGGADLAATLGVRMGGEGARPGDVAMAGRVVGVATFGKGPFGTVRYFAEREVIRRDVVPGELLLTRRWTGPEDEKQGATARPQVAAN